MAEFPLAFDAANGLRLHCDWHMPPVLPARAGLVILHGYDDHGARYGHLARRLADQGFAAITFDCRGHGKSGGRRGHCDRFEEYLSDLEGAFATVRAALPDIPLGLVAHSHGSLIALRLLCEPARTPPGLRAAVLSSPYLRLRAKPPALKVLFARLASSIVPHLALDNGLKPTQMSHDPETIEAHRSDPLMHHVATARWFTESIAAQDYVVAHVGRLSVPTLWLVAGADPVADAAVTSSVYQRASGDKAIHVYEGLYHELFHELGRERVFGDLEAWLSSKFPLPQ